MTQQQQQQQQQQKQQQQQPERVTSGAWKTARSEWGSWQVMEKPTPEALRLVRQLSSGGGRAAAAALALIDPRREAILATILATK